MKRSVYVSAAAVLICMWAEIATAQLAARVDHLTPLQRQHVSRDLIPLSAQDFFKAGQTQLEQEIRLLTHQRSPKKCLLRVVQGLPVQPDKQGKQLILQRDRTQ